MFRTSDETRIEINTDLANEQKAILVVWPCMTGSTAMYRLPVKEFSDSGISTVQFNPRGHGNSEGQFDLATCTRDLMEYIDSLDAPQAPLWLLGHSAGAFCVLKFGTLRRSAHRYILVSPVLDSIMSYRHLYDTGNQAESNMLISSLTTNREFMLSVLGDSAWMSREVWENSSYKDRINAISKGPLIGSLMEKLFIEGYNAFDDLKSHSSGTSIIMPAHDNWFPMDTTSELALTNSITIQTITEGKDHYFTGAWKYVWQSVLNMMSV